MDEKTKELIAIGASISGHCQPCLTFHVEQAKSMGISDNEIREAVAVGKTVQKGAMSAMNKFAQSVLDSPDDSPSESSPKEEKPKIMKVYDPAMCCSTGVCGPNVDSALLEFARAVKTAIEQGISVERWNLAQQPQAFAESPAVKDLLTKLGTGKLPFIFINDELKWSGQYPSAKELFSVIGIRDTKEPFPIVGTGEKVQSDGGCCAGGGCC